MKAFTNWVTCAVGDSDNKGPRRRQWLSLGSMAKHKANIIVKHK
jgi:hypothetical protein